MSDIKMLHLYSCELDAPTREVTLPTPLMHQDAYADVFRIHVTRGGLDLQLDGMTVRAWLYLAATGETMLLEGSADGSMAMVTLRPECYLFPGYATLAIQLQQGQDCRTLIKIDLAIKRTCTDTVIDPSNVLPTLPELLAQIAAMEQATAEAREAAAAADAAREGIQDDLAGLAQAIENDRAGLILLDELTIPAGDGTKHYFGVEIDRSYHYEIVLEHTGSAEGWFTIQPQSGGTGDEHNSSNRAVELLKPGEKMTLVESYNPTIVLRRPVFVWSQNGQSCTAKIYRYEDEYVETMKNRFNTFIVDAKATGYGIYNDLYSAFYKLKERYDATTPCTILIKPGEYTLDASNATESTRWSVLWTGQRDISFIGEDREHTIISMTNNVGYSARIFDITGKCKIANLTIKNLMGEGWDGPRSHNPYAIHNDGNYPADAPYDTTVENCHIYSEMFTPVGAGLQNYQRQVYKDCTFEFVGTDSNLSQWGALYIHSPADSTAANCSVLVDNCTMISRNGTKALVLPDVAGSLQYTDIPVTIRRCIGYTNGATVTDVNKERCNITEDSALNNVADWNY